MAIEIPQIDEDKLLTGGKPPIVATNPKNALSNYMQPTGSAPIEAPNAPAIPKDPVTGAAVAQQPASVSTAHLPGAGVNSGNVGQPVGYATTPGGLNLTTPKVSEIDPNVYGGFDSSLTNMGIGGTSYDPTATMNYVTGMGAGVPIVQDTTKTSTALVNDAYTQSSGNYGPDGKFYKDWMGAAPTVSSGGIADVVSGASNISSGTGQTGPTDYSGAATTASGVTAQTDYSSMYTPEQIKALQDSAIMTGNLAFLEALRKQALGQGGPSAAQAQLQQATDKNIAAMQAQAIAQRGQFNPALMRAITQQSATARQEAAGQSAALRAQEQQALMDLAAKTGTSLQDLQTRALQAENELSTAVKTKNTDAINETLNKVIDNDTTIAINNAANSLDLAKFQVSAEDAMKIRNADSLLKIAEINTTVAANILYKSLDASVEQEQKRRDSLVQAGMSDAEADLAIRTENARRKDALVKQIIDWTQEGRQLDLQAKIKLQTLKDTFILQNNAQKLSVVEQDRLWASEIEKLRLNAMVAEKGGTPEPSFLDRLPGGLSAIATLSTALFGAGVLGGGSNGGGGTGVDSTGPVEGQTNSLIPNDFGYSDKRVKNDIKPAKLLKFLEALTPVSFDYKEG